MPTEIKPTKRNPNEYDICSANWARFEKRFSKLVKRAARVGAPIPTYEILGTYEITKRDENTGLMMRASYTRVRVTQQTVKLPDGWRLIGRLEHFDGSVIVRPVPGETVPTNARTRENYCDHCNTRRARRDTFLVENDAGEIQQVGRNCIADFLGVEAEAAAKGLYSFIDAENDFEGMGGAVYVYSPLEVLTATAWVSRVCGWVPKSRAAIGTPATASIVSEILSDKRAAKEFAQNAGKPIDSDSERATLAHGWAKGIEGGNDYLHNLATLNKASRVGGEHFGLLCSTIAAYERNVECGAKREKTQAKRKASEWIGEIGERIEFTATFVSERFFNSDWGTTALLKFETESGDMVSWFSSRDSEDFGIKPGDRVEIRATVKAHKEFNGYKETQVTRGKVK